jgi:hypothetical protein
MQSAADTKEANSDQPERCSPEQGQQGSTNAPLMPEFDRTHGAEADQAQLIADEDGAEASAVAVR